MSQVIKKRKIVIASVLKPVDDTRMFEKFGQSLADSGFYEVYIIGFQSSLPPSYPHIHFFPLFNFNRLSFRRLFAPLMVLRLLLRLNPDIFITTTHELLSTALYVRLLTRCKVIYDIQENYYRNIRYLPSFPSIFRLPLALYVRIKEKLVVPSLDFVFFSDAGYRLELTFIQKAFVVLENKARQKYFTKSRKDKSEACHLLFSGTLADSTGIFFAIHVARQLHHLDNRIQLTLAGYCAQPDQLKKIQHALKENPFIRLIGGHELVPHEKIVEAIFQADFGLILYPPNQSTTNTTPTKLYEYLAAQLPIIMINHTPWVKKCTPYQAVVAINPHHIDPHDLLNRMQTNTFYTQKPGNEVYWESEADKLLSIIHTLCG